MAEKKEEFRLTKYAVFMLSLAMLALVLGALMTHIEFYVFAFFLAAGALIAVFGASYLNYKSKIQK
jgi:hypothetical protein